MNLNDVDVPDQATQDATLEALEAEAAGSSPPGAPGADPGADPAAAPGISPELALEQFNQGAQILVDELAGTFAPNWELTDEERAKLAQSIGQALALWFPDMDLPPKYVALLGLGLTCYGIANARRDPNTGTYKPLRRRAPVTIDQKPDAARASA